MTFERPEALAINRARLDHLAALNLPLVGLSVLEVGAGIGLLGEFFEERGCRLTSADGRPEHVRAMQARYPKRRAEVADLNTFGAHTKLGRFEVVFCYGTLYHTADPVQVLRELSGLCDGLLLLECAVWREDDGRLHPTPDNSALADQSLDGRGCRPARDWLWNELARRFEFVYAPRSQPAHPDYALYFPAPHTGNVRAVFVASRWELELPTLAAYLPRVYARLLV